MRNLVVSLLVFLFLGANATPHASQAYAAFGFKPAAPIAVPAFSDEEIGGLLTTLDGLMGGNAADAVWQFARRLQTGQLSAEQEQRVLAHLDQLGRSRPGGRELVEGSRRMVTQLTVGKPAPEITGTDLDGRPFNLSDYHGRVVVLAFTAEWCAICRTQIPYEQFLRSKYEKWPLTLLGVQVGSSLEDARQKQTASRVPERSWWDVPAEGGSGGAIATAWNVVGWPATYVIDHEGIIRFVDVRDEDLLKAVRQLLEKQQAEQLQATRR
jgi:peroxiredoxin